MKRPRRESFVLAANGDSDRRLLCHPRTATPCACSSRSRDDRPGVRVVHFALFDRCSMKRPEVSHCITEGQQNQSPNATHRLTWSEAARRIGTLLELAYVASTGARDFDTRYRPWP